MLGTKSRETWPMGMNEIFRLRCGGMAAGAVSTRGSFCKGKSLVWDFISCFCVESGCGLMTWVVLDI